MIKYTKCKKGFEFPEYNELVKIVDEIMAERPELFKELARR